MIAILKVIAIFVGIIFLAFIPSLYSDIIDNIREKRRKRRKHKIIDKARHLIAKNNIPNQNDSQIEKQISNWQNLISKTDTHNELFLWKSDLKEIKELNQDYGFWIITKTSNNDYYRQIENLKKRHPNYDKQFHNKGISLYEIAREKYQQELEKYEEDIAYWKKKHGDVEFYDTQTITVDIGCDHCGEDGMEPGQNVNEQMDCSKCGGTKITGQETIQGERFYRPTIQKLPNLDEFILKNEERINEKLVEETVMKIPSKSIFIYGIR